MYSMVAPLFPLMTRPLRILAGLILPALAASATLAAAQSGASTPAPRTTLAQLPPDSLERARRYATWLFAARKDSLFANVDSSVKAQMGSADVFDAMAADVAIQAGAEDRVVEERWVNRLGKRQYWLILRLVILPNGKLAGLGFTPLSQAPPIDP